MKCRLCYQLNMGSGYQTLGITYCNGEVGSRSKRRATVVGGKVGRVSECPISVIDRCESSKSCQQSGEQCSILVPVQLYSTDILGDQQNYLQELLEPHIKRKNCNSMFARARLEGLSMVLIVHHLSCFCFQVCFCPSLLTNKSTYENVLSQFVWSNPKLYYIEMSNYCPYTLYWLIRPQ